jgi:hypothetical protein
MKKKIINESPYNAAFNSHNTPKIFTISLQLHQFSTLVSYTEWEEYASIIRLQFRTWLTDQIN